MPSVRDYTSEVELKHRRNMQHSSDQLLAALRASHPRILAHLTRQHNKRKL